MPEEKHRAERPQNVVIEDRQAVSVTGVTDIESFDENTVVLHTDLGPMIVRGEGLHISRIDLDCGELSLDGAVQGLSYEEGYAGRGGFFSRLLR